MMRMQAEYEDAPGKKYEPRPSFDVKEIWEDLDEDA
jgi:hypothetical protein